MDLQKAGLEKVAMVAAAVHKVQELMRLQILVVVAEVVLEILSELVVQEL